MMERDLSHLCGKCGAALGGAAPEGLCAACLMESAFAVPSGANTFTESGPLLAFEDYELVQEIARGGMGVVYRARQLSLNRLLAVKMMLGGYLANSAERQRFCAEAETAAQLRHPNIVAIHEVGEHAGQPFFSMDLVEGQNLAQLVRDEPLPSRKAAAYLKTITEAVHYAHSRGVLHRDLKPSNILIDENDQPRVTDFGLAKRLSDSQPSTNDPQLTQTGQVLGSPSFIPPEQAGGRKEQIGPASDVYSLGAILYQMLTARPPFVAETLTQTLRMVAEQEPVAPRLLNAGVPRDLETICLKCLEKDPQRRYGTAQALADELGRFLCHEPIQARPAGLVLKTHRWCLRNKPLAITGTAILVLLLVLGIGSPIAAFRINRERRQAEASQKGAEAVSGFLSALLGGAAPSIAKGRDKTLMLEILDQASRDVITALTNEPIFEAGVRLVIGKTYEDLGDYTNALAITQEALRLRKAIYGPKHQAVAEALNNLGAILSDMGQLETAEAKDREALNMRIELFGNESLEVALSRNNLGFRLWNRGDYAGAEAMHREALRIRLKKLGRSHPDVGKSLNNLGMALWSRGEFDAAEADFREALSVFRQTLGNEHPFVATMLNNLGTVYRDLGQLDEAETMARDAWQMRQRLLGARHSLAAYSQDNFAIVLQRLGKLEEAEKLHRDALAILQEVLGTNHQYIAESLTDLALVLARKGELAAAAEMQRDALATAQRALGSTNQDAADSMDHLAVLMALRGMLAEAAPLLTNALAITTKLAGADHPDLIPAFRHLSWVRRQQGDTAAADSLYNRAAMLGMKAGNYGARAFTESTYELTDLLQLQGRFAEAEPVLLGTSNYLQSWSCTNEVFLGPLRGRLTALYSAWQRADPKLVGGSAAQAQGKKPE